MLLMSIRQGLHSEEKDKNKTTQDASSAINAAVGWFPQKLSRGVKATLCAFTVAETIVSVVLCCLLFKQRHSFAQYSVRPFSFFGTTFICAYRDKCLNRSQKRFKIKFMYLSVFQFILALMIFFLQTLNQAAPSTAESPAALN